jgi:hypothetical protein
LGLQRRRRRACPARRRTCTPRKNLSFANNTNDASANNAAVCCVVLPWCCTTVHGHCITRALHGAIMRVLHGAVILAPWASPSTAFSRLCIAVTPVLLRAGRKLSGGGSRAQRGPKAPTQFKRGWKSAQNAPIEKRPKKCPTGPSYNFPSSGTPVGTTFSAAAAPTRI